ncbi:hypothetical protein D3C71_911220 [compost metagenome]
MRAHRDTCDLRVKPRVPTALGKVHAANQLVTGKVAQRAHAQVTVDDGVHPRHLAVLRSPAVDIDQWPTRARRVQRWNGTAARSHVDGDYLRGHAAVVFLVPRIGGLDRIEAHR